MLRGCLGFLQTNTYQAILTTDGNRSYALLLYQDGGMRWDYAKLAAANVLIGFSRCCPHVWLSLGAAGIFPSTRLEPTEPLSPRHPHFPRPSNPIPFKLSLLQTAAFPTPAALRGAEEGCAGRVTPDLLSPHSGDGYAQNNELTQKPPAVKYRPDQHSSTGTGTGMALEEPSGWMRMEGTMCSSLGAGPQHESLQDNGSGKLLGKGWPPRAKHGCPLSQPRWL